MCLDNDQSIKSTRNYLGLLHSIFDFAVREGWVIANPCRRWRSPRSLTRTRTSAPSTRLSSTLRWS